MRRSATSQLLHWGKHNAQTTSSVSSALSRLTSTQSQAWNRNLIYNTQRAATTFQQSHLCIPKVHNNLRTLHSITTHVSSQEKDVAKDQLNWEDEHVIMDVAETSNRMLEVSWSSKEKDLYPYVWMRDNCQCSNCFHPIAKTRTFGAFNLDMDIHPKHIEVLSGGEDIEITWSDGHVSKYPAKWLNERAFNKYHQRKARPAFRLKLKYWGSELLENLPRASFHDILTDEKAFLAWLQQLEIYGFVVVSDAPKEIGQIRWSTFNKLPLGIIHLCAVDIEQGTSKYWLVIANLYGIHYLYATFHLPYFSLLSDIQNCIPKFGGIGG
ncbi:unnamed protein product, partial [Meganyctiphanes norvegica]